MEMSSILRICGILLIVASLLCGLLFTEAFGMQAFLGFLLAGLIQSSVFFGLAVVIEKLEYVVALQKHTINVPPAANVESVLPDRL